MVNDGKGTSGTPETGNRTGRATNVGNVGRRSFLKATGVGAGAVTLAGCTSTIGGGGGGVPDTVKLGALGPIDSPMGDSILKSANLAAKEINADGGIAGSDVEVITKDTKDDPATTRQGYQELTTGENVHATVGIFGSEQLLSIMGNIGQAQTPHLTAGAATPEAPALVGEDYETNKYWFRVGPVNSVFLAESQIQFAKDRFEQMGWEKIAFLAEDYKWTEPVTKVIKNRLESEVDVEVTQVQRIAEGTEDFTPIYDRLEANNVDGAFTALAHIGTTALVQWAQQQRPFGFGGIHVPTQLPVFYDATKGAAISTFSQTTATANSPVTDKTIPYAEAYADEYDGALPVYTGYSAYDAVYMAKDAIEAAESVNGDDLVSELESMSFTGTSGTIEFFGKNGRFPHDVKYGPELAQGLYFQWQKEGDSGVQKVIWPDDLQQAEYQAPPWA
ncbi:ABC transporter substrate-binding protein [Halorarius litoreus]|uniref:ABC transporter substrate-binding protein n=1 Tax=Halorarius litoreus TaxID=2962676 RepID=UPI0020CCDC42|nr:ABC transporter substrate-binding protein [Halorarius litoreus]